MSQPQSPIRRVINAPPALSYDPKAPQEVNYFWANFNSQLNTSETVASCSVAVTVVSGTDPSPSALLSGTCTVENGYSCKQLVTGGDANVEYLLTFSAITSASRSLVLAGTLLVQNA